MFTERFDELLKETNTTKSRADFFEVSVDYLLGRTSDIGIVEINCELTEEQEELLKIFNKMSPQQRYTLIGFAKGLSA